MAEFIYRVITDAEYKGDLAVDRMGSLRRLVQRMDDVLQSGEGAGGFSPAISRYPMEVTDANGEKFTVQRSPRQAGFIEFATKWNLQINVAACVEDYWHDFKEDLSKFNLSGAEIWTEYMCTKLERKLDGAHWTELEGYRYFLNLYVSAIPAALLTSEWHGKGQSQPSLGIRTAHDANGNQYIVNFNSRRVIKALEKNTSAFTTSETLPVKMIKQDRAREFISDFVGILYPQATITWKPHYTDGYIKFTVSTICDSAFVMEINKFDPHIHFKIFKR